MPFAEAVHLDPTTAVNGGWIDTNGQSSVAQLNFSGGKYAYWLYTNAGGLSNTPWLGCVEARPGALEEDDTAPSNGNPDTLWVPMFQPAEPNINDPENPHSTDVVNTNQPSLNSNFNGNDDYITIPNLNITVESLAGDRLTTLNNSNNATSHNLQTGDGPIRVYVSSAAGALPAPLVNSTDYWVIRFDNDTIRLATSKANALAGTRVNITNNGSGTRSFSKSPAGTDLTAQRNRQNNWEKYVGKSYAGTSGPIAPAPCRPCSP